MRFRAILSWLVVAALALALGQPAPHPLTNSRLAAAGPSWTEYHRDDAHTGLDPTLGSAIGATAGWTTVALDGQVYGEPLVYNGLVYTATLNNTVYALNQVTGAVTWSSHLGTPMSSGWNCGNVSPQGIIGTPIIDPTAGRIYVAAFFGTGVYHLVALDLTNGSVMMDTALNLPGAFNWKTQQERGALALGNGYVYVPMGGRFGDCTPYYGWVVGVPTNGNTSLLVYRTPSVGESVWAAGGIAIDDVTGDLVFATGNAIPCSGSTYSDTVVRLTSTLTSPSFFEPQDWQTNWCGPDLDLGSASPVILGPDLVFTSGKHGGGFLLDQNNLGGIDGQLFPARSPYSQADVCLGNHSDTTFGGFAYAAPYVYLECDGSGVVGLQVNTSAPSFSLCGSTCSAPSWHAGSGTYGPPIVAGGVVWAISTSGGGLTGFNAANGSVVYQSAAFGSNHFSTPSEAGGHVYAGAGSRIKSFDISFPQVSRSATSSASNGTPGNRTVTQSSAGTGGPRPVFREEPPAAPGLAPTLATAPLVIRWRRAIGLRYQ